MGSRHYFIMIFLSVLLASCHTITNYSKAEQEENERNISTAKINVELGMAYLAQNNLLRAKRKFSQAVLKAPHIPEPWYAMAYFFENSGEYERANNYYLKAIALAPERGDSHNNYGTFLCRQKKYHAAIDQFMLAVKDENYLDPSAAYENAGLCAAKIPDRKLAAKFLERSLLQNPNRPNAHYQLAAIYYHQGHFKAAEASMMQYAKIAPHNDQTLLLRSQIENKLFAEAKVETPKQAIKQFMHVHPFVTKKKVALSKAELKAKYLKRDHVKVINLTKKSTLKAHATRTRHKKPIVQNKHVRLAAKHSTKTATSHLKKPGLYHKTLHA